MEGGTVEICAFIFTNEGVVLAISLAEVAPSLQLNCV